MSEIKVWKIVPLSMVTTSEQERDKWISAGYEVVEFVSIDRIKELESQLAEAKKDALFAQRDQVRYQWLRDKTNSAKAPAPLVFFTDNICKPTWQNVLHSSDLDQAIDAAIASIQEGK